MKHRHLLSFATLLVLSLPALTACGNQDKISAYRLNSVVFGRTFHPNEGINLPTYRLSSKGDVPYVRLSDWAKYLSAVTGDAKVANKDGNTFTFGSTNAVSSRGYITFNTEKNRLSITRYDCFVAMDYPLNHGLGIDDYSYRRQGSAILDSDSTHYLQGPGGTEACEVDLDRYDIKMHVLDEELYVPAQVLATISASHYGGLCYNGKDYFFVGDMSKADPGTISYINSSQGNFVFSPILEDGTRPYYVFTKTNAEVGETYRFTCDLGGTKQLVLSCGEDHSAKFQEKDGDKYSEATFLNQYYRGYWQVNESQNSLLIDVNPTPVNVGSAGKSFKLGINLDQTNYACGSMSEKMAEYNLGLLGLILETRYGPTNITLDITDFKPFISLLPFKDELKNKDLATYTKGLYQYAALGINDGNTHLNSVSGNLPFDKEMVNNLTKQYTRGSRTENKEKAAGGVLALRNQAGVTEGLRYVGDNTAVITFDEFCTDNELSSRHMQEYSGLSEGYLNRDSSAFVASCFNSFKDNAKIQNVIFDLTANGGGDAKSIAYLLSFLSKDPTLVAGEVLTGSQTEYHYLADLNGDGVYASEGDSFQGKYNFFIATSSATFSTANLFAGAAKGLAGVKIIGEQSAGGVSAPVYYCDGVGSVFSMSGPNVGFYKNENGKYVQNDGGIPVDISLSTADFFNDDALLKAING